MPQITVTAHDNSTRTIDAAPGLSLMETLRQHGFDDIQAICGGCASCATCHVYIETSGVADALPEMDDMEDAMLDISFVRKDTSRLSCQIMVEDGMPDLDVVIAPPL